MSVGHWKANIVSFADVVMGPKHLIGHDKQEDWNDSEKEYEEAFVFARLDSKPTSVPSIVLSCHDDVLLLKC